MMLHCCEGLEAKHQPIKRATAHHSKKRDHPSANVNPNKTSIMQIA